MCPHALHFSPQPIAHVPRYRDVGLLPGAFHRGGSWFFFRCHSNYSRGTDMNRCCWCVFWWTAKGIKRAGLTFANQNWHVTRPCRILSYQRVGCEAYFTDHLLNVHPEFGNDHDWPCLCVCVFVLFKNYAAYALSNRAFLADRYGFVYLCIG